MRKIISLLIAAALLLQINISAMAANYSSKNIDMMLAVLSETDVISINDEREFDADKTVSRAEFSEYVAKAINIQPSFEMQYFNDVPKELERADYINALADYGIVDLNEEKIFEPEKPINRAEALKMLLCIMGYGDYAASKANGMDSYVVVASDAGLFINTKSPDAVTAEEAVRMIYSAMSEPMLVYDFSEKSASVDKSANIFSTYHNVYFAEGVVEATYGAYLENRKMPKENETVISGTNYDTTFDLYDFIGTTVKYVYLWDKTEDSGTVFYAEVKNEDDTFDISSDLLDDFDESNNAFYYFRDEESSRASKQTIEKSYQIIYNGVPYNGSVETAISGFKDKTRRGSVRLVDSNRNGKFDIVVIKNYEVMPSGTISLVDESIYGGFDKQSISFKDTETIRFFDTNGKEKELDDYSDVILNVARSENNEAIEIILSDEKTEFKVISTDSADNEFEADNGNVYKVDPRIISQYASTIISYNSVTAYFDAFGYIVEIEVGTTDDYLIGYLIKGKGYENDCKYEVKFKIYTQGGKIEEYLFAEKVKIDGTTYKMDKKPEAALNALPKIYSENAGDYLKYTVSPQVIRYKLNEDKEIKELDTTNCTEKEDKNNSLVQRHKQASLLNSNRVGLDTYWSSAKTAVFKIPSLNEEGLIYKNGSWVDPQAKDFGTSLSLNFDESYTCDTYNYSDTDYYTDIMVVTQEQETLERDVLIFTGKFAVWDEEENVALTAVKCIKGGSEMTYSMNEGLESQIRQLKYGDLFYISLDGSGYGTEVKKIFDCETLKFNNSGSNDYWYYGDYSPYSNWSYRTGENNRNNLSKMYALKKREEAVFGTYEKTNLNSGTYEEVMHIGSVPVIIVHKDSNSLEKGNFSSILSYEEAGDSAPLILIESSIQVAKSVIIYK